MAGSPERALATALAAVGLPVDLAARLRVDGERGTPEPRLAGEDVGVACIGAGFLAAARLQEARTGEWLPPALDRGQARASLVSERLFLIDGEPAGAAFAPASRFWPAADGWVRTHANFPWHREALLRALGVADVEGLAAAIAARPAAAVEDAAFAAGGIAAKVRTPAEWREHPQGAAVAAEPLVARLRLGDASPRCSKARNGRAFEHRKGGGAREDGPPAPAAGIRVLDLTRVIAGPVCARQLGALGADVLRIDSPALPDVPPGSPADTLLGKRSAFLDLGARADAERLEALLADADVVLLGYRPGALARFGLGAEELVARRPGLVVMELAAWGHTGPWRERRGFDSIVQAASGIAVAEAGPEGEPGVLPGQLLDHGTGHLAAAAILAALIEQRQSGGSHIVRLSLARTAHWLLGEGQESGAGAPAAARPQGHEGTAGARPVVARPRGHDSTDGAPAAARPLWHEGGAAFSLALDDDSALTAVPPPGSLGGTTLRWRGSGARYGTADPVWREAPG